MSSLVGVTRGSLLGRPPPKTSGENKFRNFRGYEPRRTSLFVFGSKSACFERVWFANMQAADVCATPKSTLSQFKVCCRVSKGTMWTVGTVRWHCLFTRVLTLNFVCLMGQICLCNGLDHVLLSVGFEQIHKSSTTFRQDRFLVNIVLSNTA